jgi:recombinational DNA repair protein RecR
MICGVEEPHITAIEKRFKGVYHVLTSPLSPVSGTDPDHLTIKRPVYRALEGRRER